MPRGLKRYQQADEFHFITFSCYRRQPRLATPQARRLLQQTLERVRPWYGLCVFGYVIMPEHSIWSQTFGYDAFGNIAKTGNSSFHPGYTSGNHVIGFTYDGMGNVTNDGANTYTYDAEGRPITVGGVQITYDALGRAIEQNRSGTYTQILYSPMGQKFGLMNGAAVKQYFVPLAGGMQAVYNSSGLQYYRHSDWLGSSRFAATTSGTVYYDGAYAPFGENYAETGTTDRSFTGQTQDTTAGLYDFLLRQQSSAQGRWLVPDPAGLAAVDITNPQTWNRYAYVANNPLNNVDPLGLDDSTTSCDSSGHCTNVTNVDVTASAPSWFWLAFEGWPGTGSSQTLFCMMFGVVAGAAHRAAAEAAGSRNRNRNRNHHPSSIKF